MELTNMRDYFIATCTQSKLPSECFIGYSFFLIAKKQFSKAVMLKTFHLDSILNKILSFENVGDYIKNQLVPGILS